MNKYILITLSLMPYVSFAVIVDPACPLPAAAPCGVAEVISCARVAYNATGPAVPIANNTDFYNKQLFDLANQDGFCNWPNAGYPPGVLAGSLQATYFDQFCGFQKGTYFSYANFVAAAEVLNNQGASAFGGAGGFACSQSASSVAANTLQSNLEVANFFASEAQETTSAMKGYTTDGLYFRYENGALLNKDTGAVCADLSCQTTYFPPTDPANYVGVANVGAVSATETYTPYLWLLTGQQPTQSSYYMQYNLANSPMYIPSSLPAVNLVPKQLAAVGAPSSVTTVLNINSSSVLNAGMYVGMGSLQLTGSSMYFFYGWYFNNLVPAQALANFSNFIGNPASNTPTTGTGFLREGQLAFKGAFWYWMYRSIGRNFTGTWSPGMFPSLHQLAMDSTRPACHCIGAVTLGINGGCNHFSYRAQYANYFMDQKALGVLLPKDYCIQTVTLPSGRVSTINGAKCTLTAAAKLDQATQDLLEYCQNPIT